MTLEVNRDLAIETTSQQKFIQDVDSKDFTSEDPKAEYSINTNFNPNDKVNNFGFTDSKKKKKFNYEYHPWAASKKVKINKRDKCPETFWLKERRQELTKP